MSINVEALSEKIFNLIKGFGYEVKSFDREGKLVIDPREATRFAVADPNILVRFDKHNQNITLAVGKNSQAEELREMLKDLAIDNLQNFDFKVFTKKLEPKSEKIDIAKHAENEMADVMEGFGPMTGSSKTSYQPLDNVKLVVRHKKPVNEESRGARSRNIHSIYIQRGEERFKMAENNLKAARAMARHIQNGGELFDDIGSAITEMAQEQRVLKDFVRYVRSSNLVNETNEEYVSLAVENSSAISEMFNKLAGVKSYANASEQVLNRASVEVLEDDVDLEAKFTETHFDDRVANAMDHIKMAMSREKSFKDRITSAVKNETFKNLKNLISENDGIEFSSPYARLGHQVGQMGSVARDPMLRNYLGSISKKIASGSSLNQFEYTTIKSCLLSAHEPRVKSIAEDFSAKYEQFIEQFDIL